MFEKNIAVKHRNSLFFAKMSDDEKKDLSREKNDERERALMNEQDRKERPEDQHDNLEQENKRSRSQSPAAPVQPEPPKKRNSLMKQQTISKNPVNKEEEEHRLQKQIEDQEIEKEKLFIPERKESDIETGMESDSPEVDRNNNDDKIEDEVFKSPETKGKDRLKPEKNVKSKSSRHKRSPSNSKTGTNNNTKETSRKKSTRPSLSPLKLDVDPHQHHHHNNASHTFSYPSQVHPKDTLYVEGMQGRTASTPLDTKMPKHTAFQNQRLVRRRKGRKCIQTIKVSIWVSSVFTLVFAFFYFFLHILLLVKVWDPVHSADPVATINSAAKIIDPGINFSGTLLPPLEEEPTDDHRHSREKSVLSLILMLLLSLHAFVFYLFSSRLEKSIRTIDNFHRFASSSERTSVGNIYRIYANQEYLGNEDEDPFVNEDLLSPTERSIPGEKQRHSSSTGCTGCSPISCRPICNDNHEYYDYKHDHHHQSHHNHRSGHHHHHHHHRHQHHSSSSSNGRKERRREKNYHPQYHVKRSHARSRMDTEMGISPRDRRRLMYSFFGLLLAILCLLIHSMIQLIFCLAVYSPFMDLMDCLLLVFSSFIIVFSVSFIFTASYYHRTSIYK